MSPKLTIGMAVFRDFNGACFTLQSLRLHHPEVLKDVEIVVVDNDPEHEEGRMLRGLCQWFGDVAAVKYLPFEECQGTSMPRQKVFELAAGDAVLCMDAHVMLPAGALAKLIAYYDANPGTRDLITGPILTDGLKIMATHFDDVWRGEMWGTWGRAWRCRCGTGLAAVDANGQLELRTLVEQQPITRCPKCEVILPVLAWPGHERLLVDGGWEPLGESIHSDPFEIPAQGLGLFSCRREAWLGFNPAFRGFGGEEYYIHHKYRQAGHKALCLPFLRWWHRFGRPGGVPYPLATWWKVRNYCLGLKELGLPLDRLKAAFPNFPEKQWAYAEAGMDWPPDAPETPPDWLPAPEWHAARKEPAKPCTPCEAKARMTTLEQRYELAASSPSDINEHAPTLKQLAEGCQVVIDFGSRPGVSTVALLAGQPARLVSYAGADLASAAQKTQFERRSGSSLEAEPTESDLLFLDTRHTADYVYAELSRHAPLCRGRIVLHDTVTNGEKGEDGGPGLLPAVRRYLRDHPEWTVMRHDRNNNGLMVLSRLASDKKEPPSAWQQGWNFLKAATRQAAGGFGHASQETMESRLALCMVCPSRNGEKCGECGCPVEKKTSWPHEACPLGTWHQEDVKPVTIEPGEIPQEVLAP